MNGSGDGLKCVESFTDLLMWQKAHKFVLGAYLFNKGFSKDEIYGLTSQFRRAAVSVPANIAEGFKRRGKADKARFFKIAQGSLEACRYYLILAADLGYGEATELSEILGQAVCSPRTHRLC